MKKNKLKIENKFSIEDYKKDLKMNLKAMRLLCDPTTGDLEKNVDILKFIACISFIVFILIFMVLFICERSGEDVKLYSYIFLISSVIYAFIFFLIYYPVVNQVDKDHKKKANELIDNAEDLRDILNAIKYIQKSFSTWNSEYEKLMKKDGYVDLISYKKLADEIANIQGFYLCIENIKTIKTQINYDGSMKIIIDIETDDHVVIKKEIEGNTQMRTDIEKDVLVFENYKKPLYQSNYFNYNHIFSNYNNYYSDFTRK